MSDELASRMRSIGLGDVVDFLGEKFNDVAFEASVVSQRVLHVLDMNLSQDQKVSRIFEMIKPVSFRTFSAQGRSSIIRAGGDEDTARKLIIIFIVAAAAIALVAEQFMLFAVILLVLIIASIAFPSLSKLLNDATSKITQSISLI